MRLMRRKMRNVQKLIGKKSPKKKKLRRKTKKIFPSIPKYCDELGYENSKLLISNVML